MTYPKSKDLLMVEAKTYQTLVLVALQARYILARYPLDDAVKMVEPWNRLAELLARLPGDDKL